MTEANVLEKKMEMGSTYMNVVRFGTGKRVIVMVSGMLFTMLDGQGAGIAAAYSNLWEDYTTYLFTRKNVLEPTDRVHEMAEDLCEILGRLGVKKACFYGVSQGGMMILDIALNHPEMVEKLAICSSYARPDDMMKNLSKEWVELGKKQDVVAINHIFSEKVYSPEYREMFKDAFKALETVGTPLDCERFVIESKACAEFDVYDRLDEIKCPVLVIGGEKDQATGIGGTKELAAKLNCECLIYENGYHALYDEIPEVKEKVKEFFDR